MNQKDATTQTNSDNKSIETQTKSNFNANMIEYNFSILNDLYNPEKSDKPFGGIFSNDDEGNNDIKKLTKQKIKIRKITRKK